MWSKVGMGGGHYSYYKHIKFRQNPRGDPKFLVDLNGIIHIVYCIVAYEATCLRLQDMATYRHSVFQLYCKSLINN